MATTSPKKKSPSPKRSSKGKMSSLSKTQKLKNALSKLHLKTSMLNNVKFVYFVGALVHIVLGTLYIVWHDKVGPAVDMNDKTWGTLRKVIRYGTFSLACVVYILSLFSISLAEHDKKMKLFKVLLAVLLLISQVCLFTLDEIGILKDQELLYMAITTVVPIVIGMLFVGLA